MVWQAQRSFFPSGSRKLTVCRHIFRLPAIQSLIWGSQGLTAFPPWPWNHSFTPDREVVMVNFGWRGMPSPAVIDQCLRWFGEWWQLWRHQCIYSIIFSLLLFYNFAFASYWQIIPKQYISPRSALSLMTDESW